MSEEKVYTLTQTQLDFRLKTARDAATYKAWVDMLARFSPAQRQDLANLMAHSWTISALEIQSKHAKGNAPGKRYDATPGAEGA